MTDTAAIETSALSKTYRGGVQALVGLDLRVERGELFGFLGPNGAGKSTTIRLLLDLIRPTAGRATVLGARRFSRRTRWTRSSTSPTASASSVRAAHPRRLRCVSARARAPSRQITFGASADPGPFAAIAGARVQQVDGTAPLRVELLVGRQVAAVERHLVWHLVVVAFAAALALAAAAWLIERRSEIETPYALVQELIQAARQTDTAR